jgi:hypothetical protein
VNACSSKPAASRKSLVSKDLRFAGPPDFAVNPWYQRTYVTQEKGLTWPMNMVEWIVYRREWMYSSEQVYTGVHG